MKNILFKKGLLLGIIVLFIGINVIPSNANILNISISTNDKISSVILESRNTIYVDDSNREGPWDGTLEHPFQTIKKGINAAKDGDTVFVFNGCYNEGYLDIDKSIKLLGEDRNWTIIDGTGYSTGLHLEADSIVISGFSIRNYYDLLYTACIVINSKNNIISGNHIRRCSRHGIDIGWSSNNTIFRNIIQLNDKSGIRIWGSGANTIIANHIVNNGYGILIYNPNEFDRIFSPFAKSYNIIMKNNIFSNSHDAYFENKIHNYWKGNYWGSTGSPKVIKGKIWWFGFSYYNIVERTFKNYDLYPTSEPYDIFNTEGCGIV